MERSTWVSAAKLTMASAPSAASATASGSQIEPCTKRYRASPATSATLAGLPAYVRASRFTTSSSGWRPSMRRTKCEPMKPQPPVTRIRFTGE